MPTSSELITQIYAGYFNRAPDPEGLNYWVSHFNGGMSLLEIAQSFSVQPETTALYSYLTGGGSPASFLTGIYNNLLGRPVDAEGSAYWTAQLAAGKPVGRMIIDIISGAQGNDAALIANKVAVGQHYYDLVSAAHSGGFRLHDAKQVLAGVDTTATSVTAARTMAAAFAVEDLTVTFNDPTGVLAPFQTAIRRSLAAAWDMWEAHFTRHAPIEMVINFIPDRTYLMTARPLIYSATGESFQGKSIFRSGVAQEYTIGNDPNGSIPDAEINIYDSLSEFAFRTSVNDLLPSNKVDAISVFAHEIGHIFGFLSLNHTSGSLTSMDRYVSAGTISTFIGPAALAANDGSPLTMRAGDFTHLAGNVDLMSYSSEYGRPRPVEPLHIAILKDIGMPVTVPVIGSRYYLNGLSASEAANVRISLNNTGEPLRVNVAGATIPGQIDILGLTIIADPLVAPGTLLSLSNIIAPGVEIINITANTNVTINSLSGATALTTLIVKGPGNFGLSPNALSAHTSLTVDASASTGLFSLSTSSNSVSSLTLIGSITRANALFGSNQDDILTGGNWIDTITAGNGADRVNGGAGPDSIIGEGGADIMTGGLGLDIFYFRATAGTMESGLVTGDTITDFTVGQDKLVFINPTFIRLLEVASLQQVAIQAAINALASDSTAAQIAMTMAASNITNNAVSFAVYGSDTYVYYENNGTASGVAADDIFIKLAGVSSGFTFAGDISPLF